MDFVLDWERVNNRYRELESINHHWAAEMELAIIFGEYELAEYLEGVIESAKRRTNGFSLNEWNDIYDHCKPYGLHARMMYNLDLQRGGVEA